MSGFRGAVRLREFWRNASGTRMLLSGVCLAGLLAGGCASHGSQLNAGVAAASGGAAVAVLPLENISERTDAGDVASRIVLQRMSDRKAWRVVAPAQVDSVLEGMRVRDPGALSPAQLMEFGRSVGARFLLTGTVLENGMVRTPDGDVPSVGVLLKLTEASTGLIVWTRMKFRTGDDHETLFGWGRIYSAQKLTADLVEALLNDMPAPPAATATSGGGENR